MNVFVIALSKTSDPRDWTLMDATTSGVDPFADIMSCTMTRESLKIVMRFQAPNWEAARRVFNWKADKDLRVPKHLLKWEEAKLLLGDPACSKSESDTPT